MTAEEARGLTEEALRSQTGEVGKRLEALYEQIAKCARDGKTSLDAAVFMKGLNSDQCAAFTSRAREQGYSVKQGSDMREGNWCYVSWNP